MHKSSCDINQEELPLLLNAHRGYQRSELILTVEIFLGAAQESTDLSSAEDDLDSWILRNVDDLTARRELIDKLIELAKPFPYKHCTNLRLLEDRSRNPVF